LQQFRRWLRKFISLQQLSTQGRKSRTVETGFASSRVLYCGWEIDRGWQRTNHLPRIDDANPALATDRNMLPLPCPGAELLEQLIHGRLRIVT
jgi:hypothetical protein